MSKDKIQEQYKEYAKAKKPSGKATQTARLQALKMK